LDFYRRVAAAYAMLAEEESDRFVRLDGEHSIDALHATIRADVQALMAA
jgi:dTMP kinase